MRTIGNDAIVEEVFVEAPPERVYRALTEPAELVKWWGDPNYVLVYIMDTRFTYRRKMEIRR